MVFWNEDIKNEFTFSIWSCELKIMAKKVKNQIGNLIFNHKNSINRDQMIFKLNM
jgi:hypothetical protein